MNLYFVAPFKRERLIASNLQDEKEISQQIKKFLDAHNFKSYYTRIWYENGHTWYDVGSHTEFFFVDANLMEQYEDEQEEEKTLYNTAQRNKSPLGYRPE